MTASELDALEADWEKQTRAAEEAKRKYEQDAAIIRSAMKEIIDIVNEPLIAFQRELRQSAATGGKEAA